MLILSLLMLYALIYINVIFKKKPKNDISINYINKNILNIN